MADLPASNGNANSNTDSFTVGLAIVQALNNIGQNIASTFPNFVTLPANSTASGVAGQVAYNSTAFVWCYAANSWARVTGTTTF